MSTDLTAWRKALAAEKARQRRQRHRRGKWSGLRPVLIIQPPAKPEKR